MSNKREAGRYVRLLIGHRGKTRVTGPEKCNAHAPGSSFARVLPTNGFQRAETHYFSRNP